MDDETIPDWRLDARNPFIGKQVADLLKHLRETKFDRDDVLQFTAFAAQYAPHTMSQLFQDLWALWMSGQKHGGYFVEFGAGDGVRLSNTHFLERWFRWNGLIAEPNPKAFDKARRIRKCHVSDLCVYSDSDKTLVFNVVPDKGELSRLAIIDPHDGHEARRRENFVEVEVTTISLNDLLTKYAAPKVIDYLSVDTEGSEFKILESFDFDRWDVRAVTVEHNRTNAEGKLDALFFANGYRRMWPEISRFDAWYVRD